ncbi:hypothetical protein [Spirochaeta africana]|uniref:Uncharacterized protein n=1 Tax=Spirochaeta africana (strain ATCC 700263 / DSM 8902 / Z-7692) TaxID=889378 RepID=H9UG53_SPIAZ|nr:hypothetical protein [Spirochaeta africana]AFG36370.1 hypothetical protein Spiaf_0262 [Spirochaeta africana DSM 8902]AFG36496.1 hypothetical protein Spiaf_0391 [Spirochaeta africana DSM 8902]
MHTPPFCPNPDCRHHHHHTRTRAEKARVGTWFWRKGLRHTACAGSHQRYQCIACKRFFTERTFSIDYRVHRTVSYRDLIRDISSRVSLAATHRNRGISPAIRRNRVGRLARNCIALHAECRPYLTTPEDLIADGFVSFEVSQYYPCNLHILIGKDSEYLFAMDHVTIRRTGRMSPRQKIRQAELEAVYRPAPDGIITSFTRILHSMAWLVLQWEPEDPVQLITDNKKEYPDAISRCEVAHRLLSEQSLGWRHISSHHHRGPGGPMFAMDNFDRELRKDMAAYVRETVTFRRNVQNAMESVQVYRMYHNFLKPYRVRGEASAKRWQRAGLPAKLVKRRLKTLCVRRAFLSHYPDIPEEDLRVWKRHLYTPGQLKQQLPWQYIVA